MPLLLRRFPLGGSLPGPPTRSRRVPALVALAVLLLGTGCGPEGTPGATPDGRTTGPAQGSEAPADAQEDCAAQVPEPGFRALFDGTESSLREWRQAGPGGFELADCALHSTGGMGLLWHVRPHGPHELRVDWRAEGVDNSGVFVGFPDPGDDPWVAVTAGREVQIDGDDVPVRSTGAVYEATPPDVPARDAALRPAGEWNTFAITVTADRVVVRLNDVVVTDHRETDQARLALPGHVGLQNHGDDDEVAFRRVRIRELDAAELGRTGG